MGWTMRPLIKPNNTCTAPIVHLRTGQGQKKLRRPTFSLSHTMKIFVQAGAHSTSVGERRLDGRAISLSPLRLNRGFPVLSSLDWKPPCLWMFCESVKRHLFTIGLLETAEGLFPETMEKAPLWTSGWTLSM